jgi:hypothetical protein
MKGQPDVTMSINDNDPYQPKPGPTTTEGVARRVRLLQLQRILAEPADAPLDMNTFSDLALGFCNPEYVGDQKEMRFNAALGLSGEAGEYADHLKKHLHQGHDYDPVHQIKEGADVIWYANEAIRAENVTLAAACRILLGKLLARYPEGHHTDEASRNRS